jgi:hypothetical protein
VRAFDQWSKAKSVVTCLLEVVTRIYLFDWSIKSQQRRIWMQGSIKLQAKVVLQLASEGVDEGLWAKKQKQNNLNQKRE